MSHYVVIGAGQAGQSLVTRLRILGFAGQVTLIGEEPVPPYQRPPLTKKYLLGEMEVERLYLRPKVFYAEHDITLRLGRPVSAIDRAAKTLRIGNAKVTYDQLALTTGALPRRLPATVGGDLGGVYTVRTLADVDAMAVEFQHGRRVLIVGGGYIGLEAAAVAALKGLQVTVVEMAARILPRVAAPETADVIRAAHESHGVKISEGTGLDRLTGRRRVNGAVLGDSTSLALDFVIVGVGIDPDTRLAEAAGLAIENGIQTDDLGRTSDPHIWAAGDCTSFPYKGRRVRLESVGNAIHQAETVAANMLGAGQPYVAQPWFWSDQYDIKLQIAGLNTGYDRVVTRPGSTQDTPSFWYYQGDTLLAVDAINDPRAYMVGKRLIEMGRSPNSKVIGNPATDLKRLLKP